MKLYSLKLDAAWRPIEVIDSFKAFSMCRSGRANVVEDYNVKAHGSSMFPAVIVLKSYVRSMNLFYLAREEMSTPEIIIPVNIAINKQLPKRNLR